MEPNESIEPTEAADPIDKMDPAEPMDKIEPVDPIDPIEPTDPIDNMDPVEPRLQIDDPSRPAKRRETSVIRMPHSRTPAPSTQSRMASPIRLNASTVAMRIAAVG